ncbi:hypothetical protein BaRGS_00036236 [Batillaria attramentaria]|uniref:Mitochondrial ribosomal protein L41 n=1 Tax=Batillaria attramentaria TaxID=370345 RepID=A0ABD0JC14_9CAEN
MWLRGTVEMLSAASRAFSTTARVHGRRSREPFDRRFPVTGKHGARFRKGGSPTMERYLAVHLVQPTGFYDKKRGTYRNVPEMIPEFVVPDLTDFKLKPYVSYKVPDIHQTKMTARDLFQATYEAEITRGLQEGTVVLKDGEFVHLTTHKDGKR